jgi:hypothetical protein
MNRFDLAHAALTVLLKQGTHQRGNADWATLPWNRRFTYGDVQWEAHWCAQIYDDVLVSEQGEHSDDWEGYHRVLIGAPLWVRTPSLRTLRIYDEYDPLDLDREAGFEGARSEYWGKVIKKSPLSAGTMRQQETVREPETVPEHEVDVIDTPPWTRRVSAWCIDLGIVVIAASIAGWFAVSVLGWPDVTGWILAAVLASSYWPTMNLLQRTPGQLIMATRPAASAGR